MEAEQFSLCWNNFHNNLRQGFHSLLQDEDLVDVTLAAEGRYLKAHKTVLSVCSPYFKDLFKANPCKHPIVILQDVNYSALNSLLQFMYQGEVSVGQEEIPTFMRVAEMLKIKGLTDNDGNASNTSMASDTNGIADNSNRSSPFMYESNRQMLKRSKPPAKKIIRPIQHLRPIESPKTVKSPASIKSPQPVMSPQPPPSKKLCMEDENMGSLLPIINPKQEPVDHDDDEFNEEDNLDMSAMLDTKLNESHASGSWTPDLKIPTDTSSPDLQEDTLPDLEDQDNRLDNTDSDAQSEHSTHNTDTEQSGSDVEITDDDFSKNIPVYHGKGKVTEWLKHVPLCTGRIRKQNIVTHVPGVKAVATNAKSPLECWKLFFPDTTIQEIVNHTNKYLRKMRENYACDRDCPDTNLDEMLALIGLLYLAGVQKTQRLKIAEMWTDDGTAPECFRATMSSRRFSALLRALTFDDIDDRNQRKVVDNLAPIRDQFEQFVERCGANYQVGEHVTVDEMLEPFRGRCKFRVYIANKPAKYGVKIYALVDSKTFYTSNLEIYGGKQPDGPYKLDNKASSVVMRITAPILNSGRNVTMDNYFTSVSLANDLFTNHRTTIVGTLRKNEREIPTQFLNIKDRKPGSSMFAFLKESVLVSYVPKKSKNVLLLSTMHNDDAIDGDIGNKTKPAIITFYNLTKGAVDVVDEMKTLYSVSRVSCRWPLTIFFSMLNIGGVNSNIIYKANNAEHITQRRMYLKELALSLMKPHLINRLSYPNLQFSLRATIMRIGGIQPENQTPSEETETKFCYMCPRRKNRKTKKSCSFCRKPICTEHTNYTCLNCLACDSDLN